MIKSITSLISGISEIHNFTDRIDVCLMCVLKYLEYRMRCRESMKNQKWAIKKIPSQCSAIFCDPPPVLFWFESCSLYVLFMDGPHTCQNDVHFAFHKCSFSSKHMLSCAFCSHSSLVSHTQSEFEKQITNEQISTNIYDCMLN